MTIYVTQTVTQPSVRKRPNHVFHLIMTLLTLGLWLPIWIVVALS